jgi:hypothetical protein
MPTVSIETSVMFFLMVTALTCAAISPPCAVITVPSSFGVWVAYTYKGMPYCLTGMMQRGCRTFAPLLAISWASSYSSARSNLAVGTERGFALNMPGTSVQISNRRACSLAAK